MHIFSQWFFCDGLFFVMAALVAFMALNITLFAWHHMQGDSEQTPFFVRLFLLSFLLVIVFGTNHILLLWASLLAANLILSRLIMHRTKWEAAKTSGWLAQKNFLMGSLFLIVGCLILMGDAQTVYIQDILKKPLKSNTCLFAGFFISLAAFTQSGVWPFHDWLKSSLNAPTAVSGFMHAGLVNGGGFLLVRFAPLYGASPLLLKWLLIIGTTCSVIGTFWKLVIPDVKRMLAASTIAQMGFMVVQCGLGLFPAAVAHLCWHGLFKSHLFLSSNTLAQQEKYPLPRASAQTFLLGVPLACLGVYAYGLGLNMNHLPSDTRFFLYIVVFLFSLEISFAFTGKKSFFSWLKGTICLGTVGYGYGFFVHLIEQHVAVFAPQTLGPLSLCILGCYIFLWLGMAFQKQFCAWPWFAKRILPLYVYILNSAQANPNTITIQKHDYNPE